MKWLLRALFIIGLIVAGGFGYWRWGVKLIEPKGVAEQKLEKSLEKYDFDSLKKRGGKAGRIEFGGSVEGVELRRKEKLENIDSKVFYFWSDGKRISGMMNNPNLWESRKKAVIIMIRGYADKEGYHVGSGSWRAADELAKAGFITMSLDFLGFGESDGESLDMMEARFEKVPAVLDLIASVKQLGYVDGERIGIWAHSNGGQIALSVLEIIGERMPTSLWAPMTNPFPQSVLDTASDLDDGGRLVIRTIEDFERNYDSRRYAFENYYEWIRSPIVIHQGSGDYWCQVEWQEKVKNDLKMLGKEVVLNVYPGDDHNLSKNWEEVVEKDINYYKKMLYN